MRRPRARRLAELGYRAAARATAAYLTRGEASATAYLRGSVGTDDFRPGLSDLDLVVVVAGRAGAERARARRERVRRAIPAVDLLIEVPRVYEEAELREVAGASTFTIGRAAYFGDRATPEDIRSLERPGLHDETASWRPLRGTDRRPAPARRDRQEERIAAWLEIVYCWRLMPRVCADPAAPRAAATCVKHVAEHAQIWLWLAHRERASGRVDALRRAARRLPEEEAAFGSALAVGAAVHRAPPAPVAEAVAAGLRLAGRIAALIGEEIEAEGAGADEVRLVGAPADSSGTLPLADWRGVVFPDGPEESFARVDADPRDPAVLAGARASSAAGPYPALVAGDLMLMPGQGIERTRLRSIQSRVTEPVPFALLGGSGVASLPRVRGWSAADMARRAVTEHGAALSAGGGRGRLLTAARAGLFHESVAAGEPALCLTAGATASRLGERFGRACDPADEPTLRELVGRLPAYA